MLSDKTWGHRGGSYFVIWDYLSFQGLSVHFLLFLLLLRDRALSPPKESPCLAQICSSSHSLQNFRAQSCFSCLPALWARPSSSLLPPPPSFWLNYWDLAPPCSFPPLLFPLPSGFSSWSLIYLPSFWLPAASWPEVTTQLCLILPGHIEDISENRW